MNILKDGDLYPLEFWIEIAFYAAITVIFLMVIALMVKLLWESDDVSGGGGGSRPTETSGLVSSKVEGWFISYGTNDDGDIESGSYKRSRNSSSSSDDLYDGNICVICFDDQRSCLFMPCGHCITCYNCAKRIITEGIKSCPICRTYIDKVRMLHIF